MERVHRRNRGGTRVGAAQSARLLLVDSHTLFRQGCRRILERTPGLHVVGEAATGREAVENAPKLCLDAVLLSAELPDMDGLEVAKVIVETLAVPVVVITANARADDLLRAVRAGAHAYLLQDDDGDALAESVRLVAAGEYLLTPERVQRLLRRFESRSPLWPVSTASAEEACAGLTPREIEVMKLVARAASNNQIAEVLGIKEATVRNYLSRLLQKLHLSSRTQLALYALRHGVAPLEAHMPVEREDGAPRSNL